jgi:hypothetical protein
MNYNILRGILDGINTIEDGIKVKVNDDDKKLWEIMICSKIYKKMYGFNSFIDLINELNKITNKEEANNYILTMGDMFDEAQINTVTRIINEKPSRQKMEKKNINLFTVKKCPHCGTSKMASLFVSYIICGYTENGIDNIGCYHDWCFKCGKKLCKEWIKDNLHVETNRKHDGKCCKKYAEEHGMDYLNDFCQCINVNVDRAS